MTLLARLRRALFGPADQATAEDFVRLLSQPDLHPHDLRRGHGAFSDGDPVKQARWKVTLPVAYVQHWRRHPIDQDCAIVWVHRRRRAPKFPRAVDERRRA